MNRTIILGFSLVELLITVAVVSILAVIMLPTYQGHVLKTRRSSCMGELVGLANAMEQYYTLNNTYLGAGTGTTTTYGSPQSTLYPAECPINSTTKYYDLTILVPDSNSYTLRATPKGAQAGNGYFELASNGVRTWDENNDGTAEVNWDGK